jgi:hypothetical protein
MIVMSAGLNAGMTALPNRDFEVSPSDTPNRDLDGIASRVMKIGPEESNLRKKQVSPHKVGEYCCGSPWKNWNFVLHSWHHAQRPDDGVPCRIRGGHRLRSPQPDLGVFLSDGPLAHPMAKRRKPPPSPPIRPSQGWTPPLARTIRLKDGTEFHSLGDAVRFVLALPNHLQDRNSWRRATELLLEAAEHGGSIEAPTERFELAPASRLAVGNRDERHCDLGGSEGAVSGEFGEGPRA